MSFLFIQVIDNPKVCRVCLAVDVKMHSLHDDPLKTYFESTTGISVMNTMELPEFLCFECAGLVRKFSMFKDRCLRGQTVLLGLIESGVQLSHSVITQIDRQQLLLSLPCATTNTETIEYNPLYDSCIEIETMTIEGCRFKDDSLTPLIPLTNVATNIELETKQKMIEEAELLESQQKMIELEEAFQDAAQVMMSDEEHFNSIENNIENNIEKNTKEAQSAQEYLNIFTEDFVESLINAEPEPLPEPVPIVKKSQSKKSNLVAKRNEERLTKTRSQAWRINAKFLGNNTKSPRTRTKSPRTSAKPAGTSAKSSTTTTKSTRSSVKSPRTKAKAPRSSAKSPSASAKTPQTVNIGDVPNGADEVDLVEYETIDLTLGQQIEEVQKRKDTDNYLHSPFKCDQCYRGFENTNTFNNHVKKHDPSVGDIECPVCKFRFPTKYRLRKHSTHHEKKYACKGCMYVCSTVTQAKLHQKWHNGVMYKCEICGKVSMRQNSHLSHMRKKHPSQYICDVCGYSFVSEQGVQQHKALMHKDKTVSLQETEAKPKQESKPYHCRECDLRFVSIEAYNRHMITSNKHSNTNNFHGGCQTCGARFESASELRAHRSKQHPPPRNIVKQKKYMGKKKKPSWRSWPTKCDHCSEEIPNAREYYAHYRRVHPDRPYPIRKDYVCDVCGKGFRKNAFLMYHMRTHSLERLFSCSTCGKSFFNRWNLDVHERTHSDARPHACKLCSKTFKFQGNLVRHYRIHNGVKPYECGICGKAFSQSNSRNIHIRTVHLNEPPPYTSKVRPEKKKKQPKKSSN